MLHIARNVPCLQCLNSPGLFFKQNEDVPAEEAQANQKGKRGRKKLDPNRPVREKKEKKVFELPGQKYDPPEEVSESFLNNDFSFKL